MSKEKSKKKGGGIIVFIILLIIIAAVLAFLFSNGMLGFGGNSDGGVIPAIGTASEDSETEAVTEEAPAETNYIDVTVSEDKYLYLNDAITIDELIEKINGFEEKCEVHITVSETATLDAVDDLTAAFDSNGIEYMIIESAE